MDIDIPIFIKANDWLAQVIIKNDKLTDVDTIEPFAPLYFTGQRFLFSAKRASQY
ncbi:hypothetical protein METHB2_20083 [Candidatus Methylobacter favarea]|uniref:Uncharacterized protein n=1 Tax=Candidatus Methylobacter favarea TaxID=2707345 RepID=A0A8S0WNA2_9GAMM|nr:hypothetical protein METHB2_20083 [Candidatus Methylobacter favarea]